MLAQEISPKQPSAGLCLAASVLTLALSACGGGSSTSSTPAPVAAPAANVFPEVAPKQGDYYVFQETITVGAGFTLPTPSVYNYTRSYTSASPVVRTDFESRSDTASSNFLKTVRNFDSGLKETGYSFGSTSCIYNPSYVFAPPFGAAAGSTFSASTTRTCGATIENITLSGTAVGVEDLTTAAGTFKAFKYTVTRNIKSSTNESVTVGTIWTDVVTGRTMKFVLNTKSNATGSTVLTGDNTVTTEVISYNAGALGASAATVKRFAGAWTVPFAGASSGTCSISVGTTGSISGTCSGGAGTSTASGSVTDAGAISVNLTDGSRITGNLTSPGAGSGTWVNGAATGTWTASHK